MKRFTVLIACVTHFLACAQSIGGSPAPSSDAGDSDGSFGLRDGGGAGCLPGLQCNVQCPGATTTSISGKVYDPAARSPLYDVAVYIPASALQPLPQGVPIGSDACSCAALFKSGAIVSTTTAVDGSFTLRNVPVGSNVPLVVQVGKWRRQFHLNVAACQDNPQTDKSLTLPSSIATGNTDDSMPDIAVSTGSADTLECLMTRIGLPATEFVAGAGAGGHVHVFAGGSKGFVGNGIGQAESPGMAGAPASPTSLWASQSQLMPYDILLLSCEGGETFAANPPALEGYLNAGGRAFASHYHYAWFSGPIGSSQSYTAPMDWGDNLASWTPNGSTTDAGVAPVLAAGTIDQTVNGTSAPFPKGQAMDQWLGIVDALGHGAPAGQVSIYQPRYNAQLGPSNKPSQSWITLTPWTMYFSFDTPVNAPLGPDGGAPNYCGRAVFSDLHVTGDPATVDQPDPPGGCATGALSPQEKVLEFMLFDLSSCVIPDTVAPSGVLP